MTRFFPSLYKMKYVNYLRNAAAQAVQFGGDCANLAGDVIANIPEQAAAVSSAVATYTETAGAAISAFVERESVETFNGVVSASSALAATLGAAVENSPSYLESFAGRVADYTTAAAAAASAYLAGKESENSIQWVQVQDDGVYVQGYGGTSGGAGASGEWDKITPPPKYPEAEKIPIVPPEFIPTGEPPKIKKIKPKEPELTGCVNKLFPRLGYFWVERTGPPWAYRYGLRYLDNIRCLRDEYAENVRKTVEWYAGSPVSLPSSCVMAAVEMMLTGFQKGRYQILSQTHNIYLWPTGYEFYARAEGWDWRKDIQYESGVWHIEESHADAWRECLDLEFGGLPGGYYYCAMPQPDVRTETVNGEGHAYSFTACNIALSYLGPADDVQETPEETTPAAYLATLGAIEALNFQNITTILGGIYGSNQNIFRR